ncbi:MAG: MFS transporter [Corynebacterium sp.]|nr:MFS transporter [Corynebacterium sp.]
MTTLIAAIGGFLFGYDTGVIAGALLFVGPSFGASSADEGWIAAVLVLGAALGALTGARVADRIGRRNTLIISGVVFAVGALLCASATNIHFLAAARALGGVAVGACSIVVPMYISERVEPAKRGRLVTLNSFMIVVGQLAAYCVNSALAHTANWRLMFLITAIPGVLLAVGMIFQPDSRPANEPRQNGAQIKAERKQALAQPWVRRTLIIAAIIGVIQQITGVNAIMYFVPTMMNRAGVSVEVSVYTSMIIGAVSVVTCLIGLLLVDRIGRRTLLSIGLAGTCVCLILVAIFSAHAWTSLAFMCLFIAFQQSAVSVVTWLLISELIPAGVRGFGMGLAGLALWLMNFVVAQAFLPLLDAAGATATFLIFAGLCAVSFVFVRRFVPETMGRTLAEVEEELKRAGSPKKAPVGQK